MTCTHHWHPLPAGEVGERRGCCHCNLKQTRYLIHQRKPTCGCYAPEDPTQPQIWTEWQDDKLYCPKQHGDMYL